MTQAASPHLALVIGGLVFAIAAILATLARPDARGNALLAGTLAAGVHSSASSGRPGISVSEGHACTPKM